MSFSGLDLERLEGALSGQAGLAEFAEALPDGLVLVDGEGRIALANSLALSMNQVAADSILGQPLGHLADLSPFDWQQAVEAYHKRLRCDVASDSAEGARCLISMRFLRNSARRTVATLFVQRDLASLDRQRRKASTSGPRDVFRFAADGEVKPNYLLQQEIAPALKTVLVRGLRALRQDARILLTGESGSGKTQIARYLHETAIGRDAPFIHVNCAAIPDSLFESEMFGYAKGAFTGALQSGKAGLIEAAKGGCLFLDEVGEISAAAQAKLLKFLEDGKVQRIGESQERRVDLLIIAATNRDLGDLVEAGSFRRDLYYRIAVISLEVPALRDEPALLDHLIDHFLYLANRGRDRPLALSAAVRDKLKVYDYPGNVRELHNILQRLAVFAEDEALLEHLPKRLLKAETARPAGDGLKDQVRRFEGEVIKEAIARHGSKRRAAKALGVDIGTIVRKTRPQSAIGPLQTEQDSEDH